MGEYSRADRSGGAHLLGSRGIQLTEQKSPSIVRLELFSDGVLAIVVTIMALELKLPELHESVASRWSYGFLIQEAPKLLSYAHGF